MISNNDLHRRRRGSPSPRRQDQSESRRQDSTKKSLFSVKKKHMHQSDFSARRVIIIIIIFALILSYVFMHYYLNEMKEPNRISSKLNEVSTQLVSNVASYDEAYALALKELKSNIILKRSGVLVATIVSSLANIGILHGHVTPHMQPNRQRHYCIHRLSVHH
jgi:hypothetical protein